VGKGETRPSCIAGTFSRGPADLMRFAGPFRQGCSDAALVISARASDGRYSSVARVPSSSRARRDCQMCQKQRCDAVPAPVDCGLRLGINQLAIPIEAQPFESRSPTIRAITSVGPPAANGTTRRTGRVGRERTKAAIAERQKFSALLKCSALP
jgi:hypothetical protein